MSVLREKSVKASKGCLIALDESLDVCSSCFCGMLASLAAKNKNIIVVLLKTIAICFFVKKYPA